MAGAGQVVELVAEEAVDRGGRHQEDEDGPWNDQSRQPTHGRLFYGVTAGLKACATTTNTWTADM